MNYIIGLFCFLFLAVFTSQTLVDLCDTLIVATALYTLIKTKDWSFSKKISRTSWFWGLWLAILVAGYIMNTSSSFPWVYFLEFRWFLSLIAMIYLLQKVAEPKQMIGSLGLLMLALNIAALFLYFYRPDARAGGINNAVMAFSQNMGMIVCFFVTFITCIYKYQIEFKYKKLFIVVSATSVLLVILTLTRGVWIASALGISITAMFVPKRVFIYTIISIGVLFSALSFLSPSFNQRVYSTSEDSKTSNNQRRNIWSANFEIFKDHPLIGVGYTLNNERLTEYYDKLNIPQTELKSHAHNQYLHFAAGTGILGLMMFLIFLGSIFRYGILGFIQNQDTLIKSVYLSLLSSFICFVTAGLTESNFSISKNRFFFLFFCAFIVALSTKDNSVKTTT
jgi:O-antigen ligase